jgi:hypothetical protein
MRCRRWTHYRRPGDIDPNRARSVMPDHGDGVLRAVNKNGGKEVQIKPKLIPRKPCSAGNASPERTASHEIGHALGVRHDTDDKNPIRTRCSAII